FQSHRVGLNELLLAWMKPLRGPGSCSYATGATCDQLGANSMDDLRNDLTQRLDELEAHISEMRKTLEHHGMISDQLQSEWDDMLRQHAELRRRLRSGEAKGSEAGAT